MAIDWDALVGSPLAGVFGEAVTYAPAPGSPIASAVLALPGGVLPMVGVFDEAYVSVNLGADPGAISAMPVLGVQLSQFPAGYDPEVAQDDIFTVTATGLRYIVKAGKSDGHGHVRLEANRAP